MKELYLVKLGGAAITDKNNERTVNLEILRNILKELRKCPGDLIIIHGAGSFGHILAKKYFLANGPSDKIPIEQQLEGISKTKTALQELNYQIHEIMIECKLRPFTLPISASIITRGEERVDSIFLDPVGHALDLKLIPILYGDIGFDSLTKFRVISGDQIIVSLVKYFHQRKIKVIFGLDIDGLYDTDPKIDENAILIKNLKRDHLDEMIGLAGDSAGIDVTGGMKGKLIQIKRILQFVDTVELINIKTMGRITNLFEGKDRISTVIQ